MNLELFINWNPSLTIGPFRWYSLCWLIGLLLAYLVVKRLYREQKISDELFDPLFIYCFIGILLGARLGHCIFYQPDYFLTSGKGVIEMFLPIHFLADGGWKFTGYEGLASHGGTLGLMIALWIYVRKTRLSIWTVLDNIAIATGTTACFIRIGNLMNSEIIGKVTDVPWAFIFERVDAYPRHPGQLYEAIAYALLFVLMWFIYKRSNKKVGSGWYFGFCLTYIFTFRFFIEYTKEIQEAFEATMPLDMGQILSIPFVVLGIACMAGGSWMRRLATVALLLTFTSNVQAAKHELSEKEKKERAEQMKKYYELYSSPEKEKEFYELTALVRERAKNEGNINGYYIMWTNEMTYDIENHHSYRALKKAEAVLQEMKKSKTQRYDLIYNVLGTIYEARGNHKLAKEYLMKSLHNTNMNDTASMVGIYIGLANLEVKENPEESQKWMDKTLPLSKKKYPTHYCIALSLKALSYFFEGKKSDFQKVYSEYLRYSKEQNSKAIIYDGYLKVADAAFNGEYDKATALIESIEESYNSSTKYDLLLQIYKMKGDKDMIIKLQDKRFALIDSLNSDMIYNNMNEMDSDMELMKTREKAAIDHAIWLTVIIVLLIVIIGVLLTWAIVHRRSRKRLQKTNKELKDALERAEISERMKRSFIQNVSHEIRTPLNVITGFAQVITNPEYVLDTEERNNMLSAISKNTNEVAEIVNELLEIAENESETLYPANDDIDMKKIRLEVLEKAFSHNTKNLDIQFDNTIKSGFTFKGNSKGIMRIIRQLMRNAIKFTENGGIYIKSYLSSDGKTINISISDTGIGIKEEDHDKIFEHFMKVDEFKQGMGLGLPMSRKIAQMMRGNVTIDKDYRNGSRFILSLPVA